MSSLTLMSSLSLLSICFDRVTIYIDVLLLLLYCSPTLLLPLLRAVVYSEIIFFFCSRSWCTTFGKIQFCVNCCRSDAVTNAYRSLSGYNSHASRRSFTHTYVGHRNTATPLPPLPFRTIGVLFMPHTHTPTARTPLTKFSQLKIFLRSFSNAIFRFKLEIFDGIYIPICYAAFLLPLYTSLNSKF